MFYAEGPNLGVCPADHKAHDGSNSAHYAAIAGDARVAHDASASASYVMAWDLPRSMHIHDNVTFRAGVAVGGWFDLRLTSHGDISFSGHFHDSGADSYDMTLTVVLMSSDGLAYSVIHQGRTHGTFESGSRDDDWARNERSNLVATNWERFATAGWRWNAHAGSLVGRALTDFVSDTAKQLAQNLGKAAVTSIVALL